MTWRKPALVPTRPQLPLETTSFTAVANSIESLAPSFPNHIKNKIRFNFHQASETLAFAVKHPQYSPFKTTQRGPHSSLQTITISPHIRRYPGDDGSLLAATPPQPAAAPIPTPIPPPERPLTIPPIDQSIAKVLKTINNAITHPEHSAENLNRLFRQSDFLRPSATTASNARHKTKKP